MRDNSLGERETLEADSLSWRSAHAARLVLAASVPTQPKLWTLVLGTDSSVLLNDRELTEALEVMTKPVHCSAKSVDSVAAVVVCEPASDLSRRMATERRLEFERGEGFYELVAPLLAWRSQARVVLRTPAADAVFTFAEWGAFLDRFDIGGESTLGIRRAEPIGQRGIGSVIVEAGRIEPYQGRIPPEAEADE